MLTLFSFVQIMLATARLLNMIVVFGDNLGLVYEFTDFVGLHMFRRKINYKQFEAALKLMAEKKYPGDDGGLEKLRAKILESGGPATHGVTVSRYDF